MTLSLARKWNQTYLMATPDPKSKKVKKGEKIHVDFLSAKLSGEIIKEEQVGLEQHISTKSSSQKPIPTPQLKCHTFIVLVQVRSEVGFWTVCSHIWAAEYNALELPILNWYLLWGLETEVKSIIFLFVLIQVQTICAGMLHLHFLCWTHTKPIITNCLTSSPLTTFICTVNHQMVWTALTNKCWVPRGIHTH